MCALTGVTLGLIQPGKGHSEVTENGNRKSVTYTARAAAPSWQSSCITRTGKNVLLLFLLMPTLYQGQASNKAVCKLFFTFSMSHCSFFSLGKETALGSHAVCFFENILCFMVFKGILWYLKLFYDSWCWMYNFSATTLLPTFFWTSWLTF